MNMGGDRRGGGALKVALILGPSTRVPLWQYEALRVALQGDLKISRVLHCLDAPRKSFSIRHTFYYGLSLATKRSSAMLRLVDMAPLLGKSVTKTYFSSDWEGNWQTIPESIHREFSDVDVVVKFGMNLLRNPESLPCKFGVIGFHHGDPEKYRGRPAGFYEMKDRDSVVGVIVQRLNNTLDGGSILARAYAPVDRTSYSATLNGAYKAGIPLLSKALAACGQTVGLPSSELGRNNTLPGNLGVLSLFLSMFGAKLSRMLYGGFVEKRWKVGRLGRPVDFTSEQAMSLTELEVLPIPPGFSFVADPAGIVEGRVFCEVMESWSQKGRIASYSDGRWRLLQVSVEGKHLSYPQIVEYENNHYLFPEMAQAGSPSLFMLNQGGEDCGKAILMKGLEGERLIDGTLFLESGMWFLFAGRPGLAGSQLDLWVSENLFYGWQRHDCSPICLDPRGARMGGPIVRSDGRLYRLGQDGSEGYGRALVVFLIAEITRVGYQEEKVGRLQISGARGPHTFLTDEEDVWLDFYTEVWTPFAGLRRIVSKLSR